MRLCGKTAIVTGAAAGFGEAMARRFAAEGARVVIADLNGRGADRVAAEICAEHEGAAVALRADVTVRADVAAMAEAARTLGERVDILVNNAGYTHRNQPMTEVDEATFDRVMAVNVKAIYLAAQVFVPIMAGQGGGVFLNTASTAGLSPRAGLTWYNGSKGAAITLSKSMAVELAPKNIRVNCLCPVAGETAMLADFMGEDTPEMRAKFIATIPWGRLSRPDDVAGAALYLVSDEADMVTGVALEVDGGRCI